MNKEERPLILVTNDDGVFAKGIKALVEATLPFGDVVVFAPDTARSGMSNAITVYNAVTYTKLSSKEGLTIYSSNGTPTDCVKLACHVLFQERRPDLLLSGINHGSNASVNVIYSGTMGAVFEGCMNGTPSIGFSLCDHDPDADFSPSIPYIRTIIEETLKKPLPWGVCLNVNMPEGDIKGVKVCRQALGYWKEEYEAQQNENGQTGYWLTGRFVCRDEHVEDTDDWALANGYVSIVPCNVDLSDKGYIIEIKHWEKYHVG